MGSRKRLRRLWQPSGETLEAIAAILGEHWRSATAHPEALLWASSVSWLSSPGLRPRAQHAPDHHLTSGGKLIR
ncbi:MAG: hypothetical protein E6K34_00050 [Gammaproteobacteria bacterium]|nr:MAG: hypothetical protein E6K34_00050 [Gammaproteobacteria bacterium]TLZ29066.1 MAG: hypothetical protein E6K25_09985 [Gammaproteobacteria bacterium]